ncbi:hypothetical protein [Vreelandella titanicae]|uniref:hypothetical protein n=1 Tax=Vreelandella titanicae TaxID=664683 RepID=UPI0037F5A31A
MDQFTDLELLAELLRRNSDRLTGSPVKRTYGTPHFDLCIGVGPDHTADITLDNDALEEIRRLT